MSDGGLSEQLEQLVAKIDGRATDPGARAGSVESDELVDELIYSFVLWEAGTELAEGAMERLGAAFVDANELRVCQPGEIAAVLGVRYPKAMERAERLAAALQGIYDRENVLGLASLREKSKRDARAYLESLAGMPKFVAARLVLLRLEAHAFPVDARLLSMLRKEGVTVGGRGPDEACTRIERAIRAADSRDAYLAFESHCDLTPSAKTKERGRASTRKASSES